MRRVLTVVVVLASSVVAVAAQADAATITVSNQGCCRFDRDQIVVVGDGRDDRIFASNSPTVLTIRDASAPLRLGPSTIACVTVDAHTVRCPLDREPLLEVRGGAGDDTIDFTGLSLPNRDGDIRPLPNTGGAADGGPGDDRLIGGPERDDFVDGPGRDVVLGRGGDDQLTPSGVAGRRADRFDGGAGIDRITYRGTGHAVDVDLGRGLARTATGAKLALSRVEEVLGTAHADRLVGSAGDDLLRGGPGTKEISGGGGDDQISTDNPRTRLRCGDELRLSLAPDGRRLAVSDVVPISGRLAFTLRVAGPGGIEVATVPIPALPTPAPTVVTAEAPLAPASIALLARAPKTVLTFEVDTYRWRGRLR